MIEVGQQAPDFELASHLGGTKFTLGQFKGQKNVMLVFYPLDWTPTWTKEIPGLEALREEFKACDTQVMGVSVDSRFSHDNWAKSCGGVSFPLLQDFHPKGEMAKKYGVYLEDKGITDRATVIIDKQGTVRYAKSVTPAGERNPKELLAEAQKVQQQHSSRDKREIHDAGTLYYYTECGFSQTVLNCMTNLHCEERIVKKNIRENPAYETELIALTGTKTVPVLVIDGKQLKGSEEINQFLVGEFM